MNFKIKTIKTIMSLILTLIVIAATCELMVFKNEITLKNKTSATFEFYGNRTEITKNITENAFKYGVAIYYIEYADELVGEYGYKIALINNEVGEPKVYVGKFNDLFFTKVDYSYFELSDIKKFDDSTVLYFIGDQEKIALFIKDLSCTYKLVEFNKMDGNNNVINYLLFFIWFSFALILSFITMYEICVLKKEIFIRVIYGNSIYKIFILNSLFDSVIYLFSFTLSCLILRNLTSISVHCIFILKIVVGLIIVNTLLYTKFFLFDFRSFIALNHTSKLLKCNNIFKVVTNVICIGCAIISLSISEVSEGFVKLASFVDNFRNYYLCEFYVPLEYDKQSSFNIASQNEILNEKIYREHFEDLKPLMFTNLVLYNDFSEEITSFEIPNNQCCNYMFTNIYAYDYLCSQIKQLCDCNLSSDFCIMMPSFFTSDQKKYMIDTSLDLIHSYYGNHFEFDYQVFEYDNNIQIPSINSMNIYRFRMNINPTIIYNSLKADTINSPLYEVSNGNYIRNILYQIDSNSLKKLKEEYSLENGIVESINLNDYYINECSKYRCGAYLAFFIVFSFLFIDLCICATSVIIYYNINSVELALKKIHGYSILERNAVIIAQNMAMVMVSAVIDALIFSYKTDNLKYIIIFSFIIIIADIICIIFKVVKSEKQNINLVFKKQL